MFGTFPHCANLCLAAKQKLSSTLRLSRWCNAAIQIPLGLIRRMSWVRHTFWRRLASARAWRAVVVVTTDKCYESREWVWGYRENDRLGGDDPYSSSKACAELLTHAYRRTFTGQDKRDLLIATARAGNVIGGGDWARDRLIPDAVRAFGAGEVLLIRAPPFGAPLAACVGTARWVHRSGGTVAERRGKTGRCVQLWSDLESCSNDALDRLRACPRLLRSATRYELPAGPDQVPHENPGISRPQSGR